MDKPRFIELLSPAKNADTAIAAITHGADAVYIGPDHFGARASAGNSVADIARAVEFAHRYDARIYATVNTILFDNELSEAERLIKQLYDIEVDALIVQDMSILRLDIPPIALHASTQCDTRTPEKARFLEDVGFSQIVLARELSADEIRAIRKATTVPLECFIHGALCVSYSGRCHASCAFRGRSANRGECAQLCRLPYDLADCQGNKIIEQKHLLSLRDFNQSDRLEELLDAGVSSMKIEGRLKDEAYVKNVTAYYNNLLNDICRRYPERYRRRAVGRVDLQFAPDLAKSFNRGFTHYFFDGRDNAHSMSSPDSPKSIGEQLGKVKSVRGNSIEISTRKPLSNGDGIVFFDHNGGLTGFRANSVDGCRITPFEKVRVAPGTMLYRNFDKAFNDRLADPQSARRTIGISISQWMDGDDLVTEIVDERGVKASVVTKIERQPAKTDQQEARLKAFSKLGNTPYRLDSLTLGDTADLFVPASTLTSIRRQAVDALDRERKSRHHFDRRANESSASKYVATSLTYADNVANRVARKFYVEHGVNGAIEDAMELSGNAKSGDVLMTTRFCLRRECGRCLRTPDGTKWPANLTLSSGNIAMSVEFDCRNCQMLLKKK